MLNLSPWQLLLWLFGFEIITAPIVVAVANAIQDGYFRAKERHFAKIMNAVVNTIEEIEKDLSEKAKKLKEEEEKKNG